ncbi:hypothetical protein ACCO45_004287 [Purpureocillium lilacinum]|uniref:Uncharacterized protein n=1 Tax=Purpureocillium lilacinum TaxID=33203 RepID=A0ACC4E2B1_PURLI
MVREGTRSQTGNSRPRVFSVPDTAPVQKRRSTKAKPAAAAGAGAGAGRKPGPKKSAAGATGKGGRRRDQEGEEGDGGQGRHQAVWHQDVERAVKADSKAVEKKVAGAVKAAEKEVKPDEDKADGAAAAKSDE